MHCNTTFAYLLVHILELWERLAELITRYIDELLASPDDRCC
jgi:hypothetical protein